MIDLRAQFADLSDAKTSYYRYKENTDHGDIYKSRHQIRTLVVKKLSTTSFPFNYRTYYVYVNTYMICYIGYMGGEDLALGLCQTKAWWQI